MKGNGKRILSLCLAAVVTVTTVGYAPPFTSSASWKSNMEKALELLASPTEAFKQVSTATPSEAESPSIEATSSEAQIPDGKATPSEAVKKFVRVEPEEIPEYYSQSSASGKRLWKFEDRYGMMQYRDYGYVQGEAEFPLWYVTDLTGKVDDTSDSANLDEEYYNLAPYVYKSVAPDQIAWANLSWRLLSDIDEINSYTRKKVSGFKNWNTSGYDIWHLVNKGDEEEDLGYHFFGIIINEEEGEREKEPGWYYSDENGNINNQAKLLLTAQFELSSPILTLDGNGGSFSDKTSMTLEVKAGDSLDQLLTDAKSQIIRKYYTFDGWYTASTGGIKYTESGNIMPTSDLTLYARWVKSSCEVIFKDWDGTVLEVQEVPIGGDAVNHIPERPNYEFMGWNRSLTNIKYDTTITAKYTLISDLDGFTVFFSRYGFDKYTKYVESIPGEHYAKVAYLHRKKLPWKNNNFYYLDTDYYNTSRYVSEIDFPKLESDDNNYLIGWTLVPGRADSYKNNGRGLYWYQPNYTLYHGQLETDESEIVFGFPLFQRRDNVKVREYMGLTSWNSTVEENNNGFGAVQTTALYLPKDKASLVLVNGIKDFHSTFHVLYENYWDKTNIGETNFTTVFQEDTPFIESISVEDFGSKVNIYSSTKYPNQRIYQGKDGIEEILSYKETDTTGTRGRSWYTTHKLIGYYSEPNGAGKELLGNYTFNKVDDRYYAYWVSKDAEFYVTFKDENGAVLGSETVTAGDPCKNVPVGTAKPGYKFIGWQPVDSDNNSTTNKVTRDTTFIAAYEKLATYQLILDGNGGTLEGNPQKEVEVAFEQSFDQVLKDGKDVVTRPGYCFDGWYTSESGGAIYSYSGNQMPSINVTVYAHWTPNTYKVTFDPDHKKWTKGVFKEEYTYDTELGILPTPDIYGLNFDGWWSGKNGTGIKITQHSMVESKDSVYYGNWSAVKYVVRFLSRVEQPEGESIQTFTVDQAYEEAFQTLPEPVERGYTFAGWYDEENKNISAQSIFRPEHLAEEYTYHARWKGNQYIIQFISNDVNGTPIVTELIQEYPSRFGTLPTPEKTGYSFAGWFDENGNEVEKGSWIDADDRIYKAKWIANQYTIHFVRNLPESGIMEEPEDKTVTYALPIGALPNLNETGYVFLGWFTEPEGGTRIKETTLAALGDQTYYGHWTIGIIDNGNGTYRKPGADGTWNTTDDELWWKGLDGISLTSDDKRILTFVNRTGTYADNENGTHYRPGTGESWTSGIELWWNGPDGIPGTDDDVRIYARGNGNSGTPIYYIDSGNGIYIRPGADGNWGSGTQYWWFGPDGTSGTDDDRQIHVLPGGGYYID
ncbi:InlB B-repeat-containing protein, partial [Lacrimispora aerotolerans]|uniref:InlB B-repeat-containing protein n=1 Tax=Lacrimispora aerotolerans TaxID=36832 RepID=UPI00055528F9